MSKISDKLTSKIKTLESQKAKKEEQRNKLSKEIAEINKQIKPLKDTKAKLDAIENEASDLLESKPQTGKDNNGEEGDA